MRKKSWVFLVFLGGSSLLFGCKMTSHFVDQSPAWHTLPLAVPLQPAFLQEMKLARIDQILLETELELADKAKLYYERGLVNDSLGLRDLAHFDFKRSLSLFPAQPEIFNILGIYYTQSAMYDDAYEAFDSTLELDENHSLASKNIGIAFYYGARYPQAERSLFGHYKENINDAYRAIWLYLLEVETKGIPVAQKNLNKRLNDSDKKDWGWNLAKLYLNEISEVQLFNLIMQSTKNNTQLAARLCEGYFYLAKRYQSQGDTSSAIALYKMALSTNVFEYLEHRYSILELSRIAELQSREV